MNRIKSIDGLRAVSIFLVLLSHSLSTIHFDFTNKFYHPIIENGSLGVRIFFVISGYLITKLLLIEQSKTGKINIKHFYLRRIFRIFPVFYIYIFVIIILKIFFIPDIFNNYNTVLFAGLYFWNYTQFFYLSPDPKGGWFLGHFWSLAMEEQFYLLWPLTFKLINNKEKLKKIVFIIILLMPVLRVITYFISPISRPQIRLMLQTGGDTILIGCLGALIENSVNFKKNYFKYFQNNLLIIFSVIFIFIISPLLIARYKGLYDLSIGISLNNFFILIILFWSIYINSFVSTVLNKKLLVQIGILSYSLYIWQQLFLNNYNDIWINRFPQNLLIVFIVAYTSYNVLEKPILKLKNRFKDI